MLEINNYDILQQSASFAESLLGSKRELNWPAMNERDFIALPGFIADDCALRARNFSAAFSITGTRVCYGVFLNNSPEKHHRLFEIAPTAKDFMQFDNNPLTFFDSALVSDGLSSMVYFSEDIFIAIAKRGIVERFLGVKTVEDAARHFKHVMNTGPWGNPFSQKYLSSVYESCFGI